MDISDTRADLIDPAVSTALLAVGFGIALVAYVAIIVIFESLIGVLQPANESTLVIVTFEGDGTAHERVRRARAAAAGAPPPRADAGDR